MLMTEDKKKYTVADYEMLEEGVPFQLINYDLIMSPSPSLIHQEILFEISEAIILFGIEHGRKGRWYYAPTDVHFDDGNVLQPDILFISNERIAEIVADKITGAPDLIIEILSPSNAYYDLRQKKDIYEKYGVKEYIIIDPAQNAEVHVLQNGVFQLHQKAQATEVLSSVVLEGFKLDLSKIFK
jgi:Uma2 family endonuclease